MGAHIVNSTTEQQTTQLSPSSYITCVIQYIHFSLAAIVLFSRLYSTVNDMILLVLLLLAAGGAASASSSGRALLSSPLSASGYSLTTLTDALTADWAPYTCKFCTSCAIGTFYPGSFLP